MHLGAMAVIGAQKPKNLVHIVVNNSAHESVGGMPTVAGQIDLQGIAQACGYGYTALVDTVDQLDTALADAKMRNSLTFLEVKCAIGARADLGRPTTSALENKQAFMAYLKGLSD
jgi:phosphonopyruvate decarboxylase